MSGKIKNIFGHWTLFEIIFLFVCEIVVTLCFVFSDSRNVFAYVASFISVFLMITISKGLIIVPFISLIYNIMYPFLAYSMHYYGEAILYVGLFIPMSILSIVSWLKNRNKEKKEIVVINKIKPIEYLYLSLVTTAALVGVYFLLRVLNTNELTISTLSLVSAAVAFYLLFRRCSYYAIASIINDILLIVLWTKAVILSGIGYLPTLVSFCACLVNDVYGFIHWKIEERKQRDNNTILPQCNTKDCDII